MRSRPQRLVAAAGLVALALAASGCGRQEEADLVNGKTLFAERCGKCHTLERAPTARGVQGPNLDEAFATARRDGLGEETIEGVVKRQIANVLRKSIMPPNLVTGDDADDVAAYVAFAAGQTGDDEGELANAGKPDVSNKPIAAKGGKLEMAADPSGNTLFASTKALAPPGPLMLVMPNPSDTPHNIALSDSTGKSLGVGEVVGKGGTSTVEATVKPGEYEYLCTVPGHAEGGMKGTLTVE